MGNNTTFRLHGKAKTVTLDSCSRVNLVVDSLISAVECVNSERLQVQAMGLVPSVSIDKCSGVQLYLSKESIDCSIITSKSSEMNVNVPQITENGEEMVEIVIPEQFQHKIVGKKLQTD